MPAWSGLGLFVIIGALGGYIGLRTHITGGVLIGAMLAVILAKSLMRADWHVPFGFDFSIQVLLGVLIGATYTPEVAKVLPRLILPVIVSTLVLIITGLMLSFLLHRLGTVDMATAYLSTSPGAMSALISMAATSGAPSHHCGGLSLHPRSRHHPDRAPDLSPAAGPAAQALTVRLELGGHGGRAFAEHVHVAAEFIVVPAVHHGLGHRHAQGRLPQLPGAFRAGGDQPGQVDGDLRGAGVGFVALDDGRGQGMARRCPRTRSVPRCTGDTPGRRPRPPAGRCR